MRIFLNLIFIPVILLSNDNTLSAGYNFHFSHLGVEHGLSQSTVFNIFQDSDGYLWFGTQNGVNKYDGYEFKAYKNEVNNPESLSDGYINAIHEDKNKNIWIGTRNGLNCMDYATGKITRFYPQTIDSSSVSNDITSIIKHPDGNLYAFTGNNNVFVCNTGKSVRLFKNLPDIASSILLVRQDTNNDIYICTSNSMYIYSENWELKRKYSSADKGFPKGRITDLLPDADKIWIGTFENGIFLFNKEKQTFTPYDKTNTQLSNNSIRVFLPYNNDLILIGTFGGLNILNKKDNSISPANLNSERYGGLGHFSIHSMLIDKDQTLWIGTYAAGISYFSPYYKTISFISSDEYSGTIGKGQEDKYGNLWFATEGGGLLYYNPGTKEQKLYPLKPLTIGNHEINIFKSILIEDDIIYCSTHLGTVYTFSIHQKKYDLSYSFTGYDIPTLLIDSRKRLWIPTSGSLHLVIAEQGQTESAVYYVNKTKHNFRMITAIMEQHPGIFVLGSYYGQIYLYDTNNHTTVNIHEKIPTEKYEEIGTVSSIVKDSSHIWISTTRTGLFKFDNNLNLVKHYGPDDGISDSYISSVVIDKHHNIWIMTGNEIFRLDKNEDKLYSINTTGSLLQEFSIYAGFTTSDGSIYLPGNKGIVSFNPQSLKTNPTIPPVYITSLIANNNEDITHTIQSDYDKDNNRKNYSVVLNSNQSNIAIKYTALNYIHANGNKYMFRMDNVDNGWNNVENRREAYYNLLPGSYTFHLKASNNDNVWNPEETTLTIRVKPPFYKTGWAYTFYILIVLSAILLVLRYRHNKRKLEQEIRYKQIEQDKLKELHEERTRMYANFSHELKTPLTLIMNPLKELAQKPSFSPEVKHSLQKMKKNTGRMLSLVDNLMDVQKYEAGKSVLNKKQFNFSAFMDEIYKSFEDLAKSRGIAFQIRKELPSVYNVCFDEAEMEKVFFNLLSNAFKFTPVNGSVIITIQNAEQNGDKYLSVQITDTGKGFSEEEAKVIFEPFYKFGEDLHQQMSGTGIGLSLARSIVVRHNGFIEAESKTGAGSTFTILLPDTAVQPEAEIRQTHAEKPSENIREAHGLVELLNNKEKKNVLLVENDREILLYLNEQLSAEYAVVKAENGKEALAVINQNAPDIVVCDILMPFMTGIELCRKIKNHPHLYHIPVILLTGKSDEIYKKEGFDAGADDYITKPFDIALLKVRIRNLVENREKIKSTLGNTHLLENLGIDKSHHKNKFLEKYIEFVKTNISNQELDVSDMYQSLGMSRANFYRKVKEVTHLSPTDLIRNIRLDAAAKLLVESDKNISEIAQLTGFSSRTYFARSFKAEFGISPSEYQKNNKKAQLSIKQYS